MTALSSLVDSFHGTTLSALWQGVFGTVAVGADGVVITNPSAYTGYGGFDSIATYDMTGSQAFVRLVDGGNQALASPEVAPLEVQQDSAHRYFWHLQAGVLRCYYANNSGNVTLTNTLTYDAATHKFFRIREASGTIYWDWSTDGSSWTNLNSLAAPWAPTAVVVAVWVGTYASEASSTTVKLDLFNTPLSVSLTAPQAAGTGAGVVPTSSSGSSPPQATATGAGVAPTTSSGSSPPQAAATGMAAPAGLDGAPTNMYPPAAAATGAGVAPGSPSSSSPPQAAATGTARPPSISIATTVNVPSATATGAARPPSTGSAASAPPATAMRAAAAPSITIVAGAGGPDTMAGEIVVTGDIAEQSTQQSPAPQPTATTMLGTIVAVGSNAEQVIPPQDGGLRLQGTVYVYGALQETFGLVIVPPARVTGTAWPPTITGGRKLRKGGIYFGQTYPGGNGIVPTPPPPVPFAAPKQVRIVRELPPTRQIVTIETPRGQCFRWASDERVGANIPSGIRNSSTAPGGYEQFDAVLPRDPAVTYADLEPMSTIRTEGIDGSEIGEYRLEATPDTSGDQMAISPSAVGWQAALNDADLESLLIIDRDLSHWGTADPQQRLEDLRNGATTYPPSVGKSYAVAGGFDMAAGNPATLSVDADLPTQDPSPNPAKPWNVWESLYDGGSGIVIGAIKFSYLTGAGFGGAWTLNVLLWNTTWQFGDGSWSGSVGLAAGSHNGVVNAPSTDRKWRRAMLQMYCPTALTEDGKTKIQAGFTNVRVIGPHGLPAYDGYDGNGNPIFTGAQPVIEGYLASDIAKYVIDNFVPMLHCDHSTIQPSTFIIPQAYYQGVKPGDMINDVTKYGEPQPDWFVWGKRTFYMHERGARANHWRARTGPAKLTESGQDISKLYNKIWVKYTDVSGVEVIVGPPPEPGDWCVPDRTYGPGGDVNTIATRLVDNSPENPLNQMRDRNGKRMIKRGLLVLSSPVGDPDDAARIGHDFLLESLAISRAGQATITGYVESARTGMLYPYHAMKAGDDCEFVDAADPSPRRINHADQDDAARVATLSLDAPPDTLSGLLERIGAQILPLGLS